MWIFTALLNPASEFRNVRSLTVSSAAAEFNFPPVGVGFWVNSSEYIPVLLAFALEHVEMLHRQLLWHLSAT